MRKTTPISLSMMVEMVRGTHIVAVVDFFQPVPTPLNKPQEYKYLSLYVGSSQEKAWERFEEYQPNIAEAVVYIHRGKLIRLRTPESDGAGLISEFLEVLTDGRTH